MAQAAGNAHFDDVMSSIVIDHLIVTDDDVIHEAKRWTTGARGVIVNDSTILSRANLADFAAEAIRVGARALSAAGQVRETVALEQLVKDVGRQTARSATEAVQVAERAAKDSATTVTKAVDEARKTLTEADARARKDFTEAVTVATTDLRTEIRRVVGGDSPELVERLQPLLEQFGARLDTRVAASTKELIANAIRQFDPADPTSPMAKHQALLSKQQEDLTEQLTTHHQELAAKVEGLATALKIREAATAVASVTPLKGDSYADQVHVLARAIAAGLGDEYLDTSATTGNVPRSKKGDGLLIVDGGAARLVVEMTDSARTGWNDYLDEAERNRDAAASLGLVRATDQNDGQTIRVLGPRRIIMAFDPETDDADLLRTVVMLLRTASLAASSRSGTNEIATAEEKIHEAIESLAAVDGLKRHAAAISKSAEKIDLQSSHVATTIRRLLGEALTALAGADVGADAVGRDIDESGISAA